MLPNASTPFSRGTRRQRGAAGKPAHAPRQNLLFLPVLLLLAVSAGHLRAEQPKDSKSKKRVRTVAILLFEGVELLDFAGPAEVFIVADHGKSFRVITVARSKRPLKTMGGITVTPSHDFGTAPPADILVVPGGATNAVGKDGISWLKRSSQKAEVVMSVCFGAFVMARAELLNGISATTHHWATDDLKRAAPRCRVVKGKRFVDSGKIITTAGVTAGIDGALHVVERILGKEAAQWTATEWMEHRREKLAPKAKSPQKAKSARKRR